MSEITRKKHDIPDIDKDMIKRIASKAKKLRIEMGYSYEDFALHAGLNRNTYFKFEKSAITGDNFTILTLLKVIRGANQTVSSFFQNL